MLLALAAIAVFAAFVLIGRRAQRGRMGWRIGAGLLSLGALGGAALTAARGDWLVAALLTLAGLLISIETRPRGGPSAAPAATPAALSEAQARAVLGVSAKATTEDIQDAYRRLMRAVHPDHGGSSHLASQLNAARDRLLGKS